MRINGFDIYLNSSSKVTGYGYRTVRVIPIVSMTFNWRNSEQTALLNGFHNELARRADVHIDNHQTFFVDDKMCFRFDDNMVIVGLVSDATIGFSGQY